MPSFAPVASIPIASGPTSVYVPPAPVAPAIATALGGTRLSLGGNKIRAHAA